jgi:hypothetical protein
MAYDLWPFILSNVGRTRNLAIRAWPGDGRVLMGLRGLELLICACCVDRRDNVASDRQDEGIHRHLVQHLECVVGNERIELRAEQRFVVALDPERSHFPHSRLNVVAAHARIVARVRCEFAVGLSLNEEPGGSMRLFTLCAPQYAVAATRQSQQPVDFWAD